MEFHLVIQSCLSLSSGMPIYCWVNFSFAVAVVLLWKNSTIPFTLSRVGFITFRACLTNRLIVCARHGWWVHLRVLTAFVSCIVSNTTNHFVFHAPLFCHFEQFLC
ncbi:hypothetical protein XENOCAPTIV_025664 [Xenoophorus captivus]|uniref:Uncharacterized protein n=1 Tax=Xenoophorus captivus TaxID=1517983 RepID=A0ABV0QK17_9TELE